MKKQWTAVILAAALGLGLLAGCGAKKEPEPPTAESLLREARENAAAAGSYVSAIQGSVVMNGDVGGESTELRLDLAMDCETIREPVAIHAAGTAGFALPGMDMDLPMEFYSMEEEGELAVYVKVLDTWMQQRTPRPPAEELAESSEYLEDVIKNAVLREELEEVRGTRAYRIDLAVPGTALGEVMSRMEMPEEIRIDWSGVQFDGTVWLAEEAKLPLRFGMKSASPIQSGDLTISRLEVLVDYMGFDTLESITVPPEAKAAPGADSLMEGMFPG